MASPTSIITHMNKDHRDSLSLYLRVYNHVSSRAAHSASLQDLTLHDLLIRTADNTHYTIPFTPPLQSLSEARARVVAMHNECLSRLGLSPIVLTEYRRPRGAQAVIFGLCAAFFILFARREHFVPASGSASGSGWGVYETLRMDMVPGTAAFCHAHHALMWWVIAGAHIAEAGVFARTKLRRHQVPVLSGVWVQWMLSVLVEGFGGFQRVNAIVREEEKKKR